MSDALELVGLPVGGPTTLALVKGWLAITDTTDDVRLGVIIGAVNSQVRTFRVSMAAVDADDWPDRITQGATMLAGRLYRRKNTASGVEAFGSQGAVYVSRNDPDIAALLRLGSYQPPTVG